MDAFPAFIPLAGRTVVVAGEGEMADAKARLFEGSPARLTRLWGEAALESEAYRGAALAFVAGEAEFCRAAAFAVRAAGVLVNVVDRPELCDFNTPGIVDRGAVVGAVGSVGAAPVLVVRLRQEIESRWPAGLGGVARLMGVLRSDVRAATADWSERRRLLSALMQGPWADAAQTGDVDLGVDLARGALVEGRLGTPEPGRVVRIVAPPEADLLTLRDARMLGAADRLIVEGQAHPDVLALARKDVVRGGEPVAAAGELVVIVAG